MCAVVYSPVAVGAVFQSPFIPLALNGIEPNLALPNIVALVIGGEVLRFPRETQLPADHFASHPIPAVVADAAPLKGVEDLQTPFPF